MREGHLEISWRIPASACDHHARLSIPDTFAAFMDIATVHAEMLGVGADAMAARSLFWLTVRTRVRFLSRPKMGEEVLLETWPEKPARLRCNRCYRLRRGEEILALGKTEWAIMDMNTGTLHPAGDVFPADLDFREEPILPEPFLRIPDTFSDAPFASYTVRSVDIDLGQHMNNVAYVRSMLGAFSNRELEELKIREVELSYRSSCYEGDKLLWQRRLTEEGLQLRAALEDGKTVILASMR